MAESIEKIKDVIEKFSPLRYQCEWDNTGWNIYRDADIEGIYICLDVTHDVIEMAEKSGCNLIVSHHPLLLEPVSEVNVCEYRGQMITEITEKKMLLFCAHTAVDSAPWGINGYIADCLEMTDREFLDVTSENEAGIGYCGNIPEISVAELAEKIKKKMDIPSLRISGNFSSKVKRIAVCGGSGGSCADIAKEKGAELLFTGEIKHHVYVQNDNIVLIEAGHYETEKCFVGIARDYLQKHFRELKYNVKICTYDNMNCPYSIY